MLNNRFPKRVEVLTKGSIQSLVNGKFDGVKRIYLIRDQKKKGDLLLSIIDRLHEVLPKQNKLVFEAKYSMGYRNKRIDIVIWDKRCLFVCKFIGDRGRMDRGAFYLDSIINHMEKEIDIGETVLGCVISRGPLNRGSIRHIKQLLTTNIIFVRLEDIFGKDELDSLCDISVV